MAFFSVPLIKRLVAFQICVVLMMGSFGSAQLHPEMDIEATTPPKQLVPPMRPMRLPIAVQGVVFCKSCRFQGLNTFTGASPLPGANVSLLCSSGRRGVAKGITDKNGYFFIQPPKVTTFGAHKCKIILTSSPLEKCKRPTNINGGLTGASLRIDKVLVGPKPIALYSTGPFAFGPTSNSSCHHFP